MWPIKHKNDYSKENIKMNYAINDKFSISTCIESSTLKSLSYDAYDYLICCYMLLRNLT